jgi:uncharacterized damage-inducible protein DinB
MASYLGRLIEYNTWANQGLLDFLRTVPPETLDATAGGVYGTIGATLEHLVTAELAYHRRLAGVATLDLPEPPEHPDLAYLRQLADRSAANLAELADSLPEPGAMIQLDDGKRAAATIFTQLVMHGCEHRAQVGTILGANGIEPPDFDSWAHGIFVHGDDWPAEWGPEPAIRASNPGD